MIQGVDVHGGYGPIDWPTVAASGVRFGWAKCTEGNEPAKDDGSFRRNVAGMREAGIIPGGYHFPYPLRANGINTGRAPRDQAERAFARSSGLGSQPGELAHVVDAEWPAPQDWARWGVTAVSISDWLQEYCERAIGLWGRKPVIYTYPWWWAALDRGIDVSWAAEYKLWMADYHHNGPGMPADGSSPVLPEPWQDWAAWQYSAQGSTERIPGIAACPVDRDCVRSETMLMWLAGLEPPDTEPEHQATVTQLPGRELGPEDEPPDAA